MTVPQPPELTLIFFNPKIVDGPVFQSNLMNNVSVLGQSVCVLSCKKIILEHKLHFPSSLSFGTI